MRIGIFVACAGRQDGGPETYEHGLVREIARSDDGNEYVVFCLSEAAAASFGVERPNMRFHVLRPSSRWINVPLSLPFALVRSGVDLYHATMYPPPFSPRPYVFTMHDVSPFAFPEFYPPGVLRRLEPLVRRGLEKARLVLCVSEHARRTTAEHFRLPPERLAVVYHGVDPRFRPVAADEARGVLRESYGLHAPYLLYVGKLMLRKNVVRLLEAYARFREAAGSDVKLVLAGRRFWDTRDIDDAMARLQVRDDVIELGYVPDAHLPVLYAGAEAAVYPTLWEGFGLPVLEAMACGTPVITSNVSALPEIAGDAAQLVDPRSVDDMAAALLRVHDSADLRRTMREKGLARASTFSWHRTAEQTVSAYRRALDA